MKKVLFTLCLVAFASLSQAASLLTCETTGSGGSIFNKINLELRNNNYFLEAETYEGNGLEEIKILEVQRSPTATKLILETNLDAKTSLVFYDKQAIIIYEAPSPKDWDKNGANVEFLSCK